MVPLFAAGGDDSCRFDPSLQAIATRALAARYNLEAESFRRRLSSYILEEKFPRQHKCHPM